MQFMYDFHIGYIWNRIIRKFNFQLDIQNVQFYISFYVLFFFQMIGIANYKLTCS